MYNEISAPFMLANGATALQPYIMRRTRKLLRPVGTIKNGVNKVLNSITRMISNRGDDQLIPTSTFYFVRLVETLAAYVMLYEHIGSAKLLPITPSDLTTRVWGIINQKNAWKDIAGRKNVKNLFGEFKFPAPPVRPPPERPTINVKSGIATLDPPPAPGPPGGAGDPPGPPGGGLPAPRPGGGDEEKEGEYGVPPPQPGGGGEEEEEGGPPPRPLDHIFRENL